jgi:hypothetical protein
MKYILRLSFPFSIFALILSIASCTKTSGPTAIAPTVITLPISSITPSSFKSGGTIVSTGGASVYYTGICYSTKPNPTTDDSISANNVGSGSFYSLISGLKTDSTYYVRAYAINLAGTGYGEELVVTTIHSDFTIGQSYEGGVIVYIDSTGQHGIIAAPSDITSSVQWGCSDPTYVLADNADNTAIGYGQANTTAIVNGCSEAQTAAKLCDELTLDGFSDWYLPSRDELYYLYVNLGKKGLGDFSKDYYWSSSQGSKYSAWMYNFNDGSAVNLYKEHKHKVRAVRSF